MMINFYFLSDPPIYTIVPPNMNGTAATDSKLTCQVKGHPRPDIQWFKNEEQLFDDSIGSGIKYIIETSTIGNYNQESSLSIIDLNYGDDGAYYCKANNTLFQTRITESSKSNFRVHCKRITNVCMYG